MARGRQALLVIVAFTLAQNVVCAQAPQPTNPPVIPLPIVPIPVKDYYPPSTDNAIGACNADSDGNSDPHGCAGRGNYVQGRGWGESSELKEGHWLICSKDGGLDKHIDGDCQSEIYPDRLSIWAKCWSVREDKPFGEGGHAYYRLGRVHMVLSTDKKDIDENCSPTMAPTGRQPENGTVVLRGCSIPPHSGVPICTVIGDPQDRPVSCPPDVGIGYCDNPQPPDQGSTSIQKKPQVEDSDELAWSTPVSTRKASRITRAIAAVMSLAPRCRYSLEYIT